MCSVPWPVRAAFVAGSWPSDHDPVGVVDDRSLIADPCLGWTRETTMWTLLDLAGSVALLLWGLHMVQTGI
jgi:hypothetical protein